MELNWEKNLSTILINELKKRQKKNPAYSLRRFASSLEISVGALSDLMSGKKSISLKRAKKLLPNLPLTPQAKRKILAQMGESVDYFADVIDDQNTDIAIDWRLTAIAGLIEIQKGSANELSLSKRLKLTTEATNKIVQSLVDRKIVERDSNGFLHKSPANWDIILTKELQEEANKNHLVIADQALKDIPFEKRFFKGFTFCGSVKDYPIYQKEIIRMLSRLSALTKDNDNDEVYRVSVQLFPFNFEN